MSAKSAIEWTDHTWNPVTGCSKVSKGCKHCYAERVFPRPYPGRKFNDIQLHYDRLDQPLRWRKPRLVFVNSMSDLFHDEVPFSFVDDMFARIGHARQHIFQILTKRPARMLEYFSARPWNAGWKNVWLGVSVEDQETADVRIPYLLKTPAAVRFLSVEPMIGPVDLARIPLPEGGMVNALDNVSVFAPHVHWVIVGGESGPGARHMDVEWARSLRDQCRATDTPFFMKQMFGVTKKAMPPIPEDLMIRQYPRREQWPLPS